LGKWYKLGCALLPAAFASEMSHAQSSVTLYGIADISIRYLSNADTAGNGRFLMGPGGMSESRWGMRRASKTRAAAGRPSSSSKTASS
jgi:predicted porin